MRGHATDAVTKYPCYAISADLHSLPFCVETILAMVSLPYTAQLPEATIAPTLQIVAPGGSVLLACSTSGATGPATWMRNSRLISDDANHSIDTATNTLTVMNFAENLAGNYTCAAGNDNGFVSSNTAMLQLAGKRGAL